MISFDVFPKFKNGETNVQLLDNVRDGVANICFENLKYSTKWYQVQGSKIFFLIQHFLSNDAIYI